MKKEMKLISPQESAVGNRPVLELLSNLSPRLIPFPPYMTALGNVWGANLITASDRCLRYVGALLEKLDAG